MEVIAESITQWEGATVRSLLRRACHVALLIHGPSRTFTPTTTRADTPNPAGTVGSSGTSCVHLRLITTADLHRAILDGQRDLIEGCPQRTPSSAQA